MDKFCSAPETTRYTYDNNGNITGIYSKVGNNNETTVATYEYDELNQLVKENNKNYTYDFGGNIQIAGNNTYSYSTGEWKDKLTSFNGEEISYDENGNPLSYLGATLTWKNGRSLASYSKDDLNITYKYNTDGLRTEKNVNNNGSTTTYKYTWNGSNLTHQSWGSKYIHFYYDNSGDVLGFTYYNGSTSADYLYAKNMQGDVVGIVDASGDTVATYTYDAWGNILTANGDLANINPIRYRGYYYDDEIDMYYLQSRYYDQIVGRFINADDALLVQSLSIQGTIESNLFVCCGNNWINYADPSGYLKIKTWIVSTALDVTFALLNHAMMIGYISFSGTIWALARTPFTRKLAMNIVKKKVIPVFVRGFFNSALTALRKVLQTFGRIGKEFAKGWTADKAINILNKYIDSRFMDLVTSLLTWGGIIGLTCDMLDGKWDGYITI